MSFIGDIGKSFMGGMFSPLGPFGNVALEMFKKVDQGATGLLSKIAGDIFQVGGGVAQAALGMLLPGPVGMLAGSLLGGAIRGAGSLAQGAIQLTGGAIAGGIGATQWMNQAAGFGGLMGAMGQVPFYNSYRMTGDGIGFVPPPFAERGGFGYGGGGIFGSGSQWGSGGIFGGGGMFGGGGIFGPTGLANGSTNLAIQSGGVGFGGGSEIAQQQLAHQAFSSGATYTPREQEVMKNMKPEDRAMYQMQKEEQLYNRMITLMTQLLQMQHETTKAIIQNLRA